MAATRERREPKQYKISPAVVFTAHRRRSLTAALLCLLGGVGVSVPSSAGVPEITIRILRNAPGEPPVFAFEGSNRQAVPVSVIEVTSANEARTPVCIIKASKLDQPQPLEMPWKYGVVPAGFASPQCESLLEGEAYQIAVVGIGLGQTIFTCAAAVTAKVAARSVRFDGQRRLLVDLQLTNRTARPVGFGVHSISSDCIVASRSLVVERDGGEIPFGGRFPEDAPGGETIAPGETLRVRGIDLTDHYRLPSDPTRLRINFHTVADLAGKAVVVESLPTEVTFSRTQARGPLPWIQSVKRRTRRGAVTTIECGPP